MKHLIIVVAFIVGTSIYAQDPVKDKMKETKVKVVKTNKNGKIEEKKVKVTTTQEQDVKTKIDPKHYENSERIATPIKVTKTVSIDNDMDPFYDSETDLVYYKSDETGYKFSRSDTGFAIMRLNNDEDLAFGTARLTSKNGYYLLNTKDYSGIGYFDANGNFVVEYYDETLGGMVVQTFGQSKL